MKSSLRDTLSSLHPSRCHIPLAIIFLLLLVLPCLAVEDLTVDISYPLTPPSELFPNIDRLKYIRSPHPHSHPSAIFVGAVSVERDFNAQLATEYTIEGFTHYLRIGRYMLSEIPQNRYSMHSTFLLSADSVSLQYDESDWYGLAKSIYGINACFTKKGRGYSTEFSSSFNRSDSLNDYSFASRYHRFYGYANMLSLEISYQRSPYFFDRKRSLFITLLDRFAHRDFLFFTPGIKAEFLSQTYFTPLLSIVYLTTKHLSFSLTAEAQALNNDIKNPYQFPHLVRKDSLRTPLNLFSVTFESSIIIDTLFSASASGRIRKTRKPVISTDFERYFLRQANLDTTIIFYDASVHFFFSRTHFDITTALCAAITPFYDNSIPYQPDYTYTFCLRLKPLRKIIIGSQLKGIGSIYSVHQGAVGTHHLLSASLEIIPSQYFSITVRGLNVTDWQGIFINGIHYPGRIIASGLTLQF